MPHDFQGRLAVLLAKAVLDGTTMEDLATALEKWLLAESRLASANLRAVLAEIGAEAKRCNTAHKDVSPSFILQRILHVEEKEDAE